METINQSSFLFLIVTIIFLYWGKLVYINGLKTIYFCYYFFNFLLFYGPLFYYKIGFVAYSNAISTKSLNDFSIISFFVVLLNIFFFKIYNKKRNTFKFVSFFENYKYGLLYGKNLKFYFLMIISIVIFYVIIYFKSFPLVSLMTNGEIGERLDVTGAIPFYITFSAISMIFIPSAFFYFKNFITNKFILLIFLLFTMFALTAGGNKGIVSFFLIFYMLISSDKIKILNILIVLFLLLLIYSLTKGITTFNSDTIEYLIESPFRRLFAAQGAGFISRLELIENGEQLLNSDYLIKQYVFSEMHVVPLGTGTAPTHFIGDVFVKYGYTIMWLIYTLYLIFFVNVMIIVDKILKGKNYSYVLWNFFILIFLNTMTEINKANLLRFSLILFNLLALNWIPRIKMKKAFPN